MSQNAIYKSQDKKTKVRVNRIKSSSLKEYMPPLKTAIVLF
jgi:hypothetical protein